MAVHPLLPITQITAAVTGQVGQVLDTREFGEVIFTAIFDYGSGGTTAKVWCQTSVDGVTWFDVANFAFALADATRISEVNANTVSAANYTPTDGTLADNTVKDGLLGSKWRTKLTTTGVYVATSLIVYMHGR